MPGMTMRSAPGPWAARSFPATPDAVRAAVVGLRGVLDRAGTDRDRAGAMEIAVAEALNNIAEHGGGMDRGCASGPVRITMRWRIGARLVVVELSDTGGPLPGGRVPDRGPPGLDGALDDLPEGGFGWLLIRSLTRRIAYCRKNGCNRLRLEFDARRTRPPCRIAQKGP